MGAPICWGRRHLIEVFYFAKSISACKQPTNNNQIERHAYLVLKALFGKINNAILKNRLTDVYIRWLTTTMRMYHTTNIHKKKRHFQQPILLRENLNKRILLSGI